MQNNSELKPRNHYLNKLISFQDAEPMKIITGIRRCGKSSLMQMMIQHLRQNGVSAEQIFALDFEDYENQRLSTDDLYNLVKAKATSISDKRLYLFCDEIQHLQGWENVINGFRVSLNCDIYLTGSNSYLLSTDYSTYLSGRYVEIKMLPLSFREFLLFHGFTKQDSHKDPLGYRHVFSYHNQSYNQNEVFSLYLRFGGMPVLSKLGFDQSQALIQLEGIYSTIVMRDVLESARHREQRPITDYTLLRKIVLFLADNIGSNISVTKIGTVLEKECLMGAAKPHKIPSAHTVQHYVSALLESFLFSEVKRFDIKGKEYLRTLSKFYIVDIGLRNYILGFRERDRSHTLENVVYFELLYRGYDVAIGKVNNQEIDFIATNFEEKIYIQVTESMLGEEVRQRELVPLKKIRDHYPKLVLSLDQGFTEHYEGIQVKNLISWLLHDGM